MFSKGAVVVKAEQSISPEKLVLAKYEPALERVLYAVFAVTAVHNVRFPVIPGIDGLLFSFEPPFSELYCAFIICIDDAVSAGKVQYFGISPAEGALQQFVVHYVFLSPECIARHTVATGDGSIHASLIVYAEMLGFATQWDSVL